MPLSSCWVSADCGWDVAVSVLGAGRAARDLRAPSRDSSTFSRRVDSEADFSSFIDSPSEGKMRREERRYAGKSGRETGINKKDGLFCSWLLLGRDQDGVLHGHDGAAD